MKTDNKTKCITEGAMLTAIASVLCVFPKFKFLANGGSVTICSMLPIILFSYRRGIKWGLAAGLAFSIVQLLTGFSSSGLTLFSVAAGILFDYLLAFSCLGLGGMYKGKLSSRSSELALGSLTVCLLRFSFHVIAGYICWGAYAQWFLESIGAPGQHILAHTSGNLMVLIYSLIYNATFMLPETIITVLAAYFLGKTSLTKELQ